MNKNESDMNANCIWCDCYYWDSESCTVASIDRFYACSEEQDTEEKNNDNNWSVSDSLQIDNETI